MGALHNKSIDSTPFCATHAQKRKFNPRLADHGLPSAKWRLQAKQIASIFVMVLATSGLLLPAIIAKCRNHYNKGAIFVLTLLGGWTLIGWVIAMVWAMMKSPARPTTPKGKVYPDCPDCKSKAIL
jgi:T4 superinfection immunity protein